MTAPNNLTPETIQSNAAPDPTDAALLVYQVNGGQSNTPSYCIQVADYTPAALATDVITISGSATKTIEITSIRVSAASTNGGIVDLYFYKRTTLDTGGTSTVPVAVPYNSTNAAATAGLKAYSVNPSALGTGQLIRGFHYYLGSKSTNASPPLDLDIDFGTRGTQPLILNGVNESLCFGLNGQTLPAGFDFYLMIEWTEQ